MPGGRAEHCLTDAFKGMEELTKKGGLSERKGEMN